MVADFRVQNHGTIVLFLPRTPDANTWLDENVQADAQWFGGALVVEPRYAEGLVSGIVESGFTVEDCNDQDQAS